MGIHGLLPFLKKASRPVNIREFKGATVAIDSYCWLHKGVFSCADQLAMNKDTQQYVYYCMKYVNNLLMYGLKPIMVFDGCRLPSKKEVEKQRRERREMHRKKAMQLLREGKRSEAVQFLQRCIDITPKIALNLMIACRDKGVDCIVAPYEADAQLAFLNQSGIADIIVTEDSDLVLFGCDRVIFKMDFTGNGMLVEKSQLHLAMDLRPDIYTFAKFRHMAILSGCDYLASLPGIGLGKASKLFKLTRQTDMQLVLRKLPTTLKLSTMPEVPDDYIQGFFKADNTFLYQLVFDPIKRRLRPLTPYPPEIDPRELDYAGPPISQARAFQIALGNIDVNTGDPLYDFNPDTFKPKSKSWDKRPERYQLSIWDPEYRIGPKHLRDSGSGIHHESTVGKEATIQLAPVKKASPVKRTRAAVLAENEDSLSDADLLKSYSHEQTEAALTPPPKRSRLHSTENLAPEEADVKLNEISHVADYTDNQTEAVDAQAALKENTPPESDVSFESPSAGKTEKSPRNAFAVRGDTARQRFNLDQKKAQKDVKSRFFKTEKPLPKTTFFHRLTEDNPVKQEEVSEEEEEEEKSNDLDSVSDSSHNTKFCQQSNADKIAEHDHEDARNNKSEVNSKNMLQSNFGFKKLDSFPSTFDKTSSLPQSNSVKKQFKPVKIEDSLKNAMKRAKSDGVLEVFSKSQDESEDKPVVLPDLPTLPSCDSFTTDVTSGAGTSHGDSSEPSLPSLSQISNVGSIDNESFGLTQSQALSVTSSQFNSSPASEIDSSQSQADSKKPTLKLSPGQSFSSLSAFKKAHSSKTPKTKPSKAKSSSNILSMFKNSSQKPSIYSKLRTDSASPVRRDHDLSSSMSDECADNPSKQDSGQDNENLDLTEELGNSETETSSHDPAAGKSSSSGKRSSLGNCRQTGLSKVKPKSSQASIASFFSTNRTSQYFK